jgi:Lhr-like helicase
MKDMVEKDPLAVQVQHLMGDLLSWREEIEEAISLADCSHTFDDLTAMVLRQDLQLYTNEHAFAICHKVTFPQYSNYHIMLAGGNLQSILDEQENFQKMAKAFGCRYLTFNGRFGWQRALKDKGWKPKFVTMWLEADNE